MTLGLIGERNAGFGIEKMGALHVALECQTVSAFDGAVRREARNEGTPRAGTVNKIFQARGLNTFYLGRETFLATSKGQLGPIREGLFGFLSRNAVSPTAYFEIPPHQVIELGTQIDL